MSKPTILSVDDDPLVSEAITRDLRERYGADYRVARATSGSDALALLAELALRDRPVALIVADQRMPRMTGIEVCLELRKDPELAKIPVLFLTAKAQESDVQRGFAAGGNDYVVKPFSPRELSTRIDALLARMPR